MKTPSNDAINDDSVQSPSHAWRRALLSPTLLLDVVVIGLMAGLPNFVLPQHVRPVPVQNVNGTWVHVFVYDAPLASDTYTYTLNDSALLVFTLLGPLAVAIILSVVSPARGAVKAWLHSFLWMFGTTEMIVSCLKAYCGYMRPYFLEECGFSDALGTCTSIGTSMTGYERGFRSFPSGHASNSASTMVHTSLRLMGALRVGHVPRKVPLGRSGLELELDGLLTLLCLVPILLAAWIAGSRVHNNSHHPADVVGGALIGGSMAVLYYTRYFQALFGPDSHRPRQP